MPPAGSAYPLTWPSALISVGWLYQQLPAETIDHRAYALCVLKALHRGLRRRDVYAVGSARWGDPRARLLDGESWEQARPQVLTALRLSDAAETHLGELADRLNAAHIDLATRLGPPDQRGEGATVRLEPSPDGRVRLHLARLDLQPPRPHRRPGQLRPSHRPLPGLTSAHPVAVGGAHRRRDRVVQFVRGEAETGEAPTKGLTQNDLR